MEQKKAQDKYIKKVLKLIRCSKERKDSILKDLEADIAAAMECGESWDEIVKRLGMPEVLAAEFNENIEEGEAGKSGQDQRILLIAAVIFIVAVIAGVVIWRVNQNSQAEENDGLEEVRLEQIELKDSQHFRVEEVERAYSEVVRLIVEGEYDKLLEEWEDDVMRTLVTKETIKAAKDNVGENWGTFQKYGSTYSVEVNDGESLWALIQITEVYENVTVTFRVTFNEDMELSGLYIW